ncbi:MAG: hypothetical protein P9M06_06990 [Candidatus Saelkia tenebricola]|nr:hypothetical protein [Candidatus Saelkia tenebricola]
MKKVIGYLFIMLLLADLSGCRGLSKKFVRKKKEQDERPNVILALEDYDELADYHELYKKHFMLWGYWCDELISSIERNFKKQKECVSQSLEHLSSLKKYILNSKHELLDTYIERLQKIKSKIDSKKISNNIEKRRIMREVEKLKRLVDKEYRYSEIKVFIIQPVSK